MKELAALFLKLGLTSFGGPAAHIAMMENEVVGKRGWLSSEEFLDMLGATNFIPGPNSTEMAIHIGYKRAGWKGLIIAGACFIFPAMLMVWALAWLYVRYGTLPKMTGFFYGVRPVVVAIIVQALFKLGRTAIKTPFLGLLAALTIILNFMGQNELLILFAAAAISLLWAKALPLGRGKSLSGFFFLSGLSLGPAPKAMPGVAEQVTLSKLFLFFLKVGSVLFGSGLVLLSFIRADLVERWHWLSQAQLVEAIAVGQMTPGPVFTTATFIGYLIAGNGGAVLATLGIFLPAFFFVALSGPLIPRLRKSSGALAFLDGLNVGSWALMAAVAWRLGGASIIDGRTTLLGAASAFLLIRYKANSAYLVLAAGALGMIIY